MILELKNIDKSFGEKEVLKGVSFTAEGGKAFGLLGRKGVKKFGKYGVLAYLCSDKSLINENEDIIEQDYYFFLQKQQNDDFGRTDVSRNRILQERSIYEQSR